MSISSISLIQKLCKEGNVVWSVHAAERMQARGISRKDVLSGVMTGKIIEDYPDDRPYPSCLILGQDENEANIHIVCGTNGSSVKVITAYYPSEAKFDEKGEKRKEHQ